MDAVKTTVNLKVPRAAIVEGGQVLNTPTVGLQVGDPWEWVPPGTTLDLSQWPADRTVISPIRGKPPEKRKGMGKAALDKMMGRGLLVKVETELRPDPPNMATHPESNVFDEAGRAKVTPIEPDTKAKPELTKKPRRRS